MNQQAIARAVQFEKYRRNFQLFAMEQLKIKGAEPGKILPLDIRVKPLQFTVWKKVQQQLKGQGFVRGVILKARQQGGSTGIQGMMYWKSSTTENFDSLLMAQDPTTTQKLFSIARHYYDHVEAAFKPMIRNSSKQEMRFENPNLATRFRNPGLRSQMDFMDASKKFAGTGLTRHGNHLSESSKYPPETTHILASSMIPQLHDLPGTYLINESTAWVEGDWFRSCCEEARSQKSRYFWVFSPWYIDLEYKLALTKGERITPDAEENRIIKIAALGQPEDEVPPVAITKEQLKWRREKILEFERAGITANGADFFNQEFPLDYDSAWISLDLFVFPRGRVLELEKKVPKPKMYRIVPGKPPKAAQVDERFDLESNYHAVWQLPIPGKMYDLGVDVSAGIEGGDWSVIQILERFTLRQVAEIHIQVDASNLAEEIYWWGAFYNWGQVGIEFNDEGIAINQLIQRMEYPYLYFWRTRSGAYPKVTRITGWKTQRDSKKLMVLISRGKFTRNEVEINSRWLLRDMANFVQIPSGDVGFTYRAQQGHDDRPMAWMIALMISEDESLGVLPESQRKIDAVAEKPGDFDIAFQEPPVGSGLKNQMRSRYMGALGSESWPDESDEI